MIRMLRGRRNIILVALLLCASHLFVAQAETIVDKINDRTTEEDEDDDGLSLFRDALRSVNLLDGLLGGSGDNNNNGNGNNAQSKKYTVFAPTNAAIKQSPHFNLYMKGLDETPYPRWHLNLKETLKQHIILENNNKQWTTSDIFDMQVTQLPSMHGDHNVVSQFEQTISFGASIIEPNVQANNGVLHVIDKVLQPKFFSESFAQLELQKEYGPDHLDRVALTDVADHLMGKGRAELNVVRESGTTFLGCRIRAFNRLEEYLPQTVNGAHNVKYGEFLNDTFREETIHNFIQYSMIPENIYHEDLPDKYIGLTVPVPNCGHMWITKNPKTKQVCFNNGCIVATPDPRQFIASNGVGYVLDKCQVCPGIAMLVDVASLYTVYNLKDMAQLLRASEWNRRDLRRSVGDRTSGEKLTLFASINTGWGYFHQEDVTRLATDKWKPHMWDLLSHMLVQGFWTYHDLLEKYNKDGPYTLKTLANQTIDIDFDTDKKKVTVEKGEIFFPNIQGVDGLVHFTNQVPLPISVTHSVYDIAKENPNFSTQIIYIDSVELDTDLKRLLPMTALYAPNKDWEGKDTRMNEIAKKVLESHMFEELWWCDTLRDMARSQTTIKSLNLRDWAVVLNDKGYPCFETLEETAKGKPEKACITKCDILARNGIVHELDSMMLFEEPNTRPPSSNNGFSDFSNPSDSSGGGSGGRGSPTVFQRPVPRGQGNSAPKTSPEFGFGLGDGEHSGTGTSLSLVVVAVLSVLGAAANLM